AGFVGAARHSLGRSEPAERLPRRRFRVARGELERLPAIRRRDEPRRAPGLTARSRERDAKLGARGRAQAPVRQAPALLPRFGAGADVERAARLERFNGEAAAVLARAD